MNLQQKLGGYLKGLGGNNTYQNIADYGMAAGLGIAGQQGMNWISGGQDPNPLISGALMTPLAAAGIRYGRGQIASYPKASEMLGIDATQRGDMLLSPRSQVALNNPIERQLAYASTGATGAGLLSSFYNTTTNTPDIDPNISGSILAAAVPLTAYLMNRRAAAKANPQSQTIFID